jgi:hypothetical protein
MKNQDKGLARWKRIGVGRALVVAAGAAVVFAAAPAGADSPNKGRLSLSVGSDFTTAYFFRGILQERDGFIWQPYGELGFNLYTADEASTDPVRTFSLFAGSWNSINSEKTLSDGSGPGNWYESDFYAGLKANFFGNTEAKAFYIAYSYPNGAFKTVQELDFQLTLNDTQWLDKWALNPYVLFGGEFDNTALGTDKGVYTEIGVRPSFVVIDDENYPVSLALPLKIGLSMSNYYEDANGNDDTFGFFQGGPVVSVPLAFIPAEYGSWAASAGVALYAFGNNLKQYNDNDTPWVVGTTSITFSY